MSIKAQKPVRSISWQDEIIRFFLQYFAKKLLDFLFMKAKVIFTFETQRRINRKIFVMFALDFLPIMFSWMLYIPKEENIHEYSDLLRRYLRLHLRYHQLTSNDSCPLCIDIFLAEAHFKKYVSDPSLYPSFYISKDRTIHYHYKRD
jgi:hypothetical protein